ncbi:MAG: hypothetical protein ABH854_00440 [Candidatus Diapherotrites archaeon]|nr:hypothetical protein [Candidatus Micrarchaeota archaeon]MBU1939897.1 hypothetical protein [Candidatus Micrarchaeota archaeon]
MEIIESHHWKLKRPFRKDIENYMLSYAVSNCKNPQTDKHHKNALDAVCRIPQTGKILKVVFRRLGKDSIKLITAYYLD